MELEVKESKSLKDGKHTGEITKVEYRTTPYEYTDVFIKEEETDIVVKYGVPTILTEKSKLGKLLAAFVEIKTGTKVDPETVLVGKKVEFMTLLKETDKGEFAEVVGGSVKPQQ